MTLKELKKLLNKFPDKEYGDYEVEALISEYDETQGFLSIEEVPFTGPEGVFNNTKKILFDFTN